MKTSRIVTYVGNFPPIDTEILIDHELVKRLLLDTPSNAKPKINQNQLRRRWIRGVKAALIAHDRADAKARRETFFDIGNRKGR
jgi:hypothetical protein